MRKPRSTDATLKGGENDLRLVVNLKEIFNLPFFPEDDSLRQAIGQDVLDKIRERATSSDFLGKSSSKGYSEEYAESDAGVIFGKNKGAPATLEASGDMLNSMTVELPSSSDKLEIAFLDSLESQKAHGHIHGSNFLPKRDFFGLTNTEVREISGRWESQVVDAAAIELAGESISQGDDSDLDFILGLLNGEG